MGSRNGRLAAVEELDTGDVEVEGGVIEPLLGPTAAPGDADRAKLPRLARHTVTLDDGHQIGVAVCGEGVPFVVVHGFSAEGFLYAQSLWRLVDMGFKVVAIDTAGHGGTQGLPTGGADFAAYTELLRRALDTLGIEQAVFAGHSMGGRLVTQLAATDPDRVIAVLLVDAIVGKTWDRIVWLSRVWPPVLVGVAVGLLLDTVSTVPLFRDQKQAAKLGRLVAPTLLGHVRKPWRLLGPAASILRSPGSGWMLDLIRQHKIPLAAIHGDRDVVVPVQTGRDSARRADGVLVVVQGATHSWLLKDPETMPAIVHDLMRKDLGTAVLRARLKAGIDGDAARAEIESNPWFYAPDALVVALTPTQRWHDDESMHRAPRYRWRTELDWANQA